MATTAPDLNSPDMKTTARILSDQEPIRFTMSVADVWLMISAVQLAQRHPGMHGHTREHFASIIAQMSQAIIARHPEAERLFAMGNNPAEDVDADGRKVAGDDLRP